MIAKNCLTCRRRICNRDLSRWYIASQMGIPKRDWGSVENADALDAAMAAPISAGRLAIETTVPAAEAKVHHLEVSAVAFVVPAMVRPMARRLVAIGRDRDRQRMIQTLRHPDRRGKTRGVYRPAPALRVRRNGDDHQRTLPRAVCPENAICACGRILGVRLPKLFPQGQMDAEAQYMRGSKDSDVEGFASGN